MENPYNTLPPKRLPKNLASGKKAPGRFDAKGDPIAVIDIGSNSVRLVVYESLSRCPIMLYNEKVMCGLGKGVKITQILDAEAVDRALGALTRYRLICDQYGIDKPYVLATAAARDALNGAVFLQQVAKICRVDARLLSGLEEAQFAARGVLSSFYHPDGIVGDQGGGSLELVDVKNNEMSAPISFPLGVIALSEMSNGSLTKARKIVRETLKGHTETFKGKNRIFYAIGGTWRSLVKLHMQHRAYPLHVIHSYTMPAREVLDFCELIMRSDPDALPDIEIVNSARQDHLRFGALVLEEILKAFHCYTVVFSAAGLREGLLYSLLETSEQDKDPLLTGAKELGYLRSRDPSHGFELSAWVEAFLQSAGLEETQSDMRLRKASCLLADIGWRAHPDYRGEQSFNMIAHAPFLGVDHAGRSFMASTIYYRHDGVGQESAIDVRLRELASTRQLERARILGAVMRVAFVLSCGLSGVLGQVSLRVHGKELVLQIPKPLEHLNGERVQNRLKRLAKLIKKTDKIHIINVK